MVLRDAVAQNAAVKDAEGKRHALAKKIRECDDKCATAVSVALARRALVLHLGPRRHCLRGRVVGRVVLADGRL